MSARDDQKNPVSARQERIEVHQFACLDDNYGILIHDRPSGQTLAIDVPDAECYMRECAARGWQVSQIFITHHHADHTQGLARLKAGFNAHVTGPGLRQPAIAGIDHFVEDGERLTFAGRPVIVIATPGHTLDQISFWLPDDGIAHTGDTLFAMGCGRVFEGDMEMMWRSLNRLARTLPGDTKIYCGHEYSLANARFACAMEPDNDRVRARAARISTLRKAGTPTLPTIMAEELATNPFLRCDDAALKAALGMEGAAPHEVFAALRTRKDRFQRGGQKAAVTALSGGC